MATHVVLASTLLATSCHAIPNSGAIPGPDATITGLPAGATCGPFTLPIALPFSIPCLLTAGGRPGALPSGFSPQPLTAGAVCGPFTLPINLPFSPPCPYSNTAAAVPAAATTRQTRSQGQGQRQTPTLPPVFVTSTLTLVPDPPYTPDTWGMGVRETTMATVRRS